MFGGDIAFVQSLATGQHHIATVGGLDVALVDHTFVGATTEHPLTAGIFAGIGSRGGDETTDADFRAFAKQHAVLVEQKHLAIGLQVTKNLRAVVANDAVDGHRRCIGLLEHHGVARANAEVLPIDAQHLAELVDRHHTAIDVDRGVAVDDFALCGQHIRSKGTAPDDGDG